MAIPGLQLGAPNPGTAMMRVPGLAKALVGSGMTGWQKRAKYADKNSLADIQSELGKVGAHPILNTPFGGAMRSRQNFLEGAGRVKQGTYYHNNNRVNADGTMTPLSQEEIMQINSNFAPAMPQQGAGQAAFRGSPQPNQQLIAALMPRNKMGYLMPKPSTSADSAPLTPLVPANQNQPRPDPRDWMTPHPNQPPGVANFPAAEFQSDVESARRLFLHLRISLSGRVRAPGIRIRTQHRRHPPPAHTGNPKQLGTD